MIRAIFDTDIGTDVDDALALGVILGSPEVELLGITTVYGDTVLRAQLAKRLAEEAQREISFPFIPGESDTFSGREVWWPGHEGKLFDDLDEMIINDLDAIDFLTRTVSQSPGEIDIFAVGPLTNIAAALRRDPQFSKNVRRLIVMGGDFSREERISEHNFRCDSKAAAEVFASELNILVTGLDVTTQVSLGESEIHRIEKAGEFGALLKGEIEQFWQFHGKPWNNPHDPVAVLAVIVPELFAVRVDRVEVSVQHGGIVIDTPTGREVNIVHKLDGPRVVLEIVNRIVAA